MQAGGVRDDPRAVNPISEYLREQAAAHRATAAENPDDPRYPQSAQALDAGRGIRHVFAVGIPASHELSDEVRAEIEAIDPDALGTSPSQQRVT